MLHRLHRKISEAHNTAAREALVITVVVTALGEVRDH